MPPSPLLLPELLSEVFEHLCRMSSPDIRPDAPPIILSQVCSLWRTTAHATPLLWSSLALTSRQWSDQQHSLALLEKYLQYSGALPLNIYFEFDTSDPYYRCDNDPNPFVKAISRHANRWMNLSLKLPQDPMIQFITDLPTVSAPLLTSLKLVETSPCGSSPPSPEDRPDVSWDSILRRDEFCVFPSMRKLSLSWIQSFPPALLLRLFPASQIQELSLMPHYNSPDQISVVEVVDLLSSFWEVQKLTLFLSNLDNVDAMEIVQHLESISLESLTNLYISGHPTAISHFWSMFHQLPKLQRVCTRYPANDPDEYNFVALLERSGRTVKEEDDDDIDYYGCLDGEAIQIVKKCTCY